LLEDRENWDQVRKRYALIIYIFWVDTDKIYSILNFGDMKSYRRII
tara:strand:+ start:280 stop:417 length:138 start_codon:yes stop_codon:yes gene_type:complete